MQTTKNSHAQFCDEVVDQANDVERVVLGLDQFDIMVPADLALPLMQLICGGRIRSEAREDMVDMVRSWIDCLESCETVQKQHADLLRRLLHLTGEPVFSPLPKKTLSNYMVEHGLKTT